MPQGLQAFDSNGTLILDITDRLTRVLGTGTTTTSNGSLSVPAMGTGGTPWVIAIDNDLNATVDGFAPRVLATTSGVSWTFPSVTVKRAVFFIYGLY